MPTKKRSGTPSAASSPSRRPEPLTLFLDESLDSDSIARALAAAGATVERLTRHFPKGTDDRTWLSLAGSKRRVVLAQRRTGCAGTSPPRRDGKLMLGTWQAIHLYEHRTAAHSRSAVVVVVGERG